jgi:mRNA interferase MazF
MVIARGDVLWVDYGPARGSGPAMVRPAVVLEDNWLLATHIRTVLVVPMTSNTALDVFPGNVLIPAESSGLSKDSVAVVSQIGSVDREFLDPYPAGRLPAYLMKQVSAGVRLVTGI